MVRYVGRPRRTPDPNVNPPGLSAARRIVPDGGSATYGSDAVAGGNQLRDAAHLRRRHRSTDQIGYLAMQYHHWTQTSPRALLGQRLALLFIHTMLSRHAIWRRPQRYVKTISGSERQPALTCNPAMSRWALPIYGLPLPGGPQWPNQTSAAQRPRQQALSERSAAIRSMRADSPRISVKRIKVDVSAYLYRQRPSESNATLTRRCHR